MSPEGPTLLLLLAAAALGSTALPTRATASVESAQQDGGDVMAALRASVQQRLSAAGMVIADPHAPPPPQGTQSAQFFNFPNFPNYFRNCFSSSWRNC
jgi:hypothetical protein